MATPKTSAPKVKNGKRIDSYVLRLDGGIRPRVYVFLVKDFRGDRFVVVCPELDITEQGTDLRAVKKEVQALGEVRGAVTWENYLEVSLCFDGEPDWHSCYEQKNSPPPGRLSLHTTRWEIMQAKDGTRRGRRLGYSAIETAPSTKATVKGEVTVVVRDTPEHRAGLEAVHRKIQAFSLELLKEFDPKHAEATLVRYAGSAVGTLAVPDAAAKRTPKRARKGAS